MLLLAFANSDTVLPDERQPVLFAPMGNGQRRAAVTAAVKEQEAKALRELWEAREKQPPQAVLGEDYGIGNQSAVSQFMNGLTPLSWKAATGFAKAFGCQVADFSPRLAAEAAAIAKGVPDPRIPSDVGQVLTELDRLPAPVRRRVLRIFLKQIELEQAKLPQKDEGEVAAPPDLSHAKHRVAS